ncbi:hypothetical protein ACEI36_22000 [Pseudomonas kielensis]|uniref:pPIWI-associating nuclease domain-containing protein n=1 Tax=Pseudomonas kielensis TaxID=2762577 RepID=UPI00389CDE0C
MKNPYRWNQLNLNLIYGRDSIINEMLESLPSVNGDSFGLTGARRMGKTTVLRAVERDLIAGQDSWRESGSILVPVYIDGLALPRPLTAELLWSLINSKIHQILAPDSDEDKLESAIEFSEFVKTASKIIDAQDLVPKIIVIFDEIEHIIINNWSSAFFANWRALLSNYPGVSGYFSAVFSGALEMTALQHDVGSPLMDVLQWKSLRNLNYEDMLRLMSEPANLSIEEDCAAHMFLETGGHPMVVQYAMQKAINTNKENIFDGIVSSLTSFEEERSWQLSEWWSKYCDATSQLVYAGLPADGSFKPISAVTAELGGYAASKAFEVLQHVGIADLDRKGKQIRRLGTIFSRWQEENGNVTHGAAFDSSLANLLEGLMAGLREKYVSAWAIYSQDMPNYSGAVSEIRDLITLTLHRIAPDDEVEAQAGFQYERDQNKPTRRQRVTYLFGSEKREQGKAVASEDELLEAHSVRLAGVVSKAYANASALTHTTATRPLAYQALKQGESILAQLLSRHVEKLNR